MFKIGWALILSVPIYYACKWVAGFIMGVRHELKQMWDKDDGEDDDDDWKGPPSMS